VTKNSYHVSSRGEFAIGSTPEFIDTIRVDVSLKPHLVKWLEIDRLGSTSPQKALKTVPVRQIIVGDQGAAKQGKQAWRCFPATHITPGVTRLIGARMTNPAENLGPERVGPIPVWHVRQVWSYSSKRTVVPVVMDYFISRTDSTVVRSTLSAALPSSGIITDLPSVDTFTKYGENVHATLPAGCTGKMTSIVARGIELLGSSGSLSARAPSHS
jgi:hypothetical protein